MDGDYAPPAENYLNTYFEFLSDIGGQYAIRPSVALQDALRTNISYGIPTGPQPPIIDLTGVTENRSVNQCNTPPQLGVTGGCYLDGNNVWYSADVWKDPTVSISKGVWHKIELHLKMNDIVNNVGVYNGIMKEWIDGALSINRSDVLFRTNQDANKKWAQIFLGPFIGDGSPIPQTMWFDELIIGQPIPDQISSSINTSSFSGGFK
jgi:hypothetical protein